MGEHDPGKPADATDWARIAAQEENARRYLLERLERIPGVVAVRPSEPDPPSAAAYRVYVRNGDTAAEYAVYDLRGSLYDLFPNARLDVLLFEESDLARSAG